MAEQNGWPCFAIPPDIGGRYSVLTPVGLLPMAVAGIDVTEVLKGAARAMEELCNPALKHNPCYRYAAARRLLDDAGFGVELFVCYQPAFGLMGEWLKQLFGESEGKEGRGLFPAYAGFSADLHSMGQFIQEGSPVLFETVVDLGEPRRDLTIPAGDGADGFDFLAGRTLEEVNRTAMAGALLAHSGGAPNLVLSLPRMDEEHFGYLVYFFEKACAISAYMLSVNPFDQPGVESYKKNMFALLGKSGYEELARTLLDTVQP
jgi:glucose-6-phosphate isomerase